MVKPSKRPLRVFLCHASADIPKVRVLYERLVAIGIDAWLDEKKLMPGQKWQIEIPKAVTKSDVVIVCLSKKSINQEGFVQKEIKIALDVAEEKLERSIFIIPARLENCDTPDRLIMYQWVDLFAKDGYEKLLRALIARAKEKGARPPSNPNLESPFTLFLKKLDIIFRNSIDLMKRLFEKYWFWTLFVIPVFFMSVLIKLNYQTVVAYINPSLTPTSTFTPAATSTKSAILNQVFLPTNTPTYTPTFTFTPTITSTSTPFPKTINDNKGVDMVLIPKGEFVIGYDKGVDDEKPQRSRLVDAFYIDKFEVTNKLYAACVKTGDCKQPHNTNSSTRLSYYNNPNYDDYPVIYVDWYMAKTYCEWRGARLPTEPEWEKAARNTDGRLYPWGNNIDYSFANYSNYVGDTTKVGSYEIGKSKYGVYDMAGNVSEWVSSIFWSYPYQTNLSEDDGDVIRPRVTRGGSWRSGSVAELRTSYRIGYHLYYQGQLVNFDYLGFRCAHTINQ